MIADTNCKQPIPSLRRTSQSSQSRGFHHFLPSYGSFFPCHSLRIHHMNPQDRLIHRRTYCCRLLELCCCVPALALVETVADTNISHLPRGVHTLQEHRLLYR